MNKLRGECNKQKGFTLVELIITVGISAIVLVAIVSVMLLINNATNSQFDDSLQRSDVRLATTYLTNDVRYSKSLKLVNQKEFIVTDDSGEEIRYYLKYQGGKRYLARESTNLITYQEIKDVNFSLVNSDLVSVDLFTGNNKSNVKLSRWNQVVNIDKSGGSGGIFNDVFIYGNYYKFTGNRVEAPEGGIYIDGNLTTNDLNGGSYSNIKNIYINGNIDINGGSAGMGLSDKNLGDIYVSGDFNLRNGWRNIYANVYVGRNAFIKDAVIHGDIYVNGDLQLDWTPTFHGKAYYTGELKGPKELLKQVKGKCIKVDYVEPFVLDYQMPKLRQESWYSNNGYKGNVALSDNVRIYSEGSYSYTLHNVNAENIVVVSKGDITISGNWTHASGILFAPYGKVTIKELRGFDGIIIAKNGVVYDKGGSVLKYKSIEDILNRNEEYPFK